jgi:hypothetical protein
MSRCRSFHSCPPAAIKARGLAGLRVCGFAVCTVHMLLKTTTGAMVGGVQGTAIEATLWGDFADKHHDILEEGKVGSWIAQPADTRGFYM